jgi:hypothetical protein
VLARAPSCTLACKLSGLILLHTKNSRLPQSLWRLSDVLTSSSHTNGPLEPRCTDAALDLSVRQFSNTTSEYHNVLVGRQTQMVYAMTQASQTSSEICPY